MKKMAVYFCCLIGCVWTFTVPAFSASNQLGAPPEFPSVPLLEEKSEKLHTDPWVLNEALRVDPQNLEESRDFYYSNYIGSEGVAMNWTGEHSSCNAGTTSQAYKDSLLLELNYFRAMAGVPAEVTFFTEYNTKAQEAALMMSVNGQLSHDPPTFWTCYTANGAEAAGSSNLMMGVPSLNHIIAGYMEDSGSSNYFVGHRRWALYPQTQMMGTGDVPSDAPYYQWTANALWVFDSHIWEPRPATREEYVAWPPPGYVPYQVVYPRWSFAYDDADLSGATVTMTQDGSPVSVTQETYSPGYGENTLVWRPFNMAYDATWPTEHLATYEVTISNVVISRAPRSFTYSVTVFDPAEPLPRPEIEIRGNGSTIADGDTTPSTTDHTSFGTTPVGTPISRTYTIANTGDEDLTLTLPVALTGADCADFDITAQPATSVVAAAGTTTFTIQYSPADLGDSDTCTVTVANDDSDENPYDFDIQGTAESVIDKGTGWLPAIYLLLL
ncbi:MAG: choice-of-anchor D domain-containing protein [Deltaproteobacteria bacterium]|nr:choice-of-anchor D domain-containing protein [Deltaproteobacteria bacterium]